MLQSVLNQVPLDTILLVIALIASISTPFVTHILDNKHRTKIYRLKSIDETEAFAFHEYLIKAGEVISGESDSFAPYVSAHYLAYLYAPDNARILMNELLQPLNAIDLGNGEHLDIASTDKLSKIAAIFDEYLNNLRINKKKKYRC